MWRLLNAGARIYVCGDGRAMAPGVRDALRTLHDRHNPGGDSEEWLRALVSDGRYVEDVYAG